ncbi:MAG: hypothetical protein A2086_00375 [Spirochaetes bacterium GWD1_27_9]|nr:MAG: hypothetical protein A2Z98_15450 [Spirochaetes bacterium GWB1_27_13]OHD23402.1 MAG: hypothetical protein A2Y34_18765 [Spirochaetes bacterium GWC1_27_15]OHD43025.1 MAG: hypothetical protein A2086_00375 [Spirochaetes bacterium GWD1_27_9]
MSIFNEISSTISGMLAIKPVLEKELGSKWFSFIMECSKYSKEIFEKTKWAKEESEEAKYVKPLSFFVAVYLRLKEVVPSERFDEVAQAFVEKAAFNSDMKVVKKYKFMKIKDSYKRWMFYEEKVMNDGFGLLQKHNLLIKQENKIHLQITRCVFYDFFKECGVPKLTCHICDYDKLYHKTVFPEYQFDRNGDTKNTIAYNAPQCDYVWKKL